MLDLWGTQVATWTELVGQLPAGWGLFDSGAVPQAWEGPYVGLGLGTAVPMDDHTMAGNEETATVDVWVPAGWAGVYGAQAAKDVMATVDARLHHKQLTTAGGQVVWVVREIAELVLDESEPGEAWHHGVLRYRLKTLGGV